MKKITFILILTLILTFIYIKPVSASLNDSGYMYNITLDYTELPVLVIKDVNRTKVKYTNFVSRYKIDISHSGNNIGELTNDNSDMMLSYYTFSGNDLIISLANEFLNFTGKTEIEAFNDYWKYQPITVYGINPTAEVIIDYTKPSNFYTKGQYTTGTAYANKQYFDTKRLAYNQVDKFLMLQLDTFNVVTQFQIYFKDNNDNQVAYINYVLGSTSNPSNVKIVDGLSSNLDIKTFIISLTDYNLSSAKTYYIDFLTSPSPQGLWIDKLNNTLNTSTSNYWGSLYNGVGIEIYNNGYNKGKLDENFRMTEELSNYGYSEYLRGKEDGLKSNEAYQEGLNKGLNDGFYADFDKWIVPAIIVVLFVGGFLTIRRTKQE